jgi:hypothetical protein
MKISRSGRYRYAGTTQLVDTDLSNMKATKHFKPWRVEEQNIFCKATGDQGNASYNYQILITSNELLHFLTLGIDACAGNRLEKAEGMATVSKLRELLKPIENDANA